MTCHVRLLGVLHSVWGGMGLLICAALLLLAGGAAAIARTTTEGDPMTAGFTALLFFVFALAAGAGGWANSWAGRSIRRHHAPGRVLALSISVVNLFVLPFGTALAIYTFWVLLHNDARALFVTDVATAH